MSLPCFGLLQVHQKRPRAPCWPHLTGESWPHLSTHGSRLIVGVSWAEPDGSAMIRVMCKRKVVQVVGLFVLLGLVLLVTSALYLWNAQYTLLEERRGSAAFKLAPYRFRPIVVFEFQSKSVVTDRFDRVIFGARTIEKVEHVTWLNRDQAVLMDLVATLGSAPAPGPAHLFFDFKRNCLLTTLDGLTTETEFQQSVAHTTAGHL